MNILLLGAGGREHALAWKLAQSPLLRQALTPRRATRASRDHAELVALDATDHAAVVAFCADKRIGLVVIGPEAPLVDGLADSLRAAGIAGVRPVAGGRAARRLEGLHQGPVRARGHPDRRLCPRAFAGRGARRARRASALPVVIKADGLAAGKGVVIAETARRSRGGARRHVRRAVRRRPAPKS